MAYDPKARPRVRIALYCLGREHQLYDPSGRAHAELNRLVGSAVSDGLLAGMVADGELRFDSHLAMPVPRTRQLYRLTRKGAELALKDAITYGILPEGTPLVWDNSPLLTGAEKNWDAAIAAVAAVDAFVPPSRRERRTRQSRDGRAQRQAAETPAGGLQRTPRSAKTIPSDLRALSDECLRYLRNLDVLLYDPSGVERRLATVLSVSVDKVLSLTRAMMDAGLVVREGRSKSIFGLALPEQAGLLEGCLERNPPLPAEEITRRKTAAKQAASNAAARERAAAKPKTNKPQAPSGQKAAKAASTGSAQRSTSPPLARVEAVSELGRVPVSDGSTSSREITVSSTRRGEAPNLPGFFGTKDFSRERTQLMMKLEEYLERHHVMVDVVTGVADQIASLVGCKPGQVRSLTMAMMEGRRLVRISGDGKLLGVALPSYRQQLADEIQRQKQEQEAASNSRAA